MSSAEVLRSLKVVEKTAIAKDITLFVLQDPEGGELSPFRAGAHVSVQVPTGAMRQYSLCGAPADKLSYKIAVKCESEGRGGSLSLVHDVSLGDDLPVGTPVNLFQLDPKAKKHLFIAGGIGITPIMAMLHELVAEGVEDFKLIYLVRSPEEVAFSEMLCSDEFAGKVIVHYSQGGKRYDLWKWLEKPVNSMHVYCCGSLDLMDSVKDMTGHWPNQNIHFESFGADTKPHADDQAFSLKLKRSGKVIEVGAKQTILDALRKGQIHVPSSCESGTCGSCKLLYTAGDVDHRDLVLMDDEKQKYIIVCVSRSKSPCLEIDL